MDAAGGCHLRFRGHVVTLMTEGLVYRGRDAAGAIVRRGPGEGLVSSRPEPAAESGDSAAAGIAAG